MGVTQIINNNDKLYDSVRKDSTIVVNDINALISLTTIVLSFFTESYSLSLLLIICVTPIVYS